MHAPTSFVSVIIPVFNDADRLARCLKALDGQTYPKDSFEIIVVDNGSSDDVEQAVSNRRRVQLTLESQMSSFAARNKGVATARGEILAFVDSDCIPSSNWIEMGVRALNDRPNRVVAGKVGVFARDARHPTCAELYDMITSFEQQEYVEKYRFGATANLFVFRETFARVGSFNAETKSCGDVEWGQRACALGCDLVYASDVRVNHPARRSLSSLYAKVVRTIGGVHDLSVSGRTTFKHPFRRSIIKDLLPPVNHCLRLVRDNRLNRTSERLRVLPVVFFVRYVQAFERLRLRLGGASRRR